jgi:putative endopeptidase
MRSLFAVLAAGTILGGCATRSAELPPPPEAALVPAATTPGPVAAPAPKPQYGTFGIDTAGMDKSVLPGNDFFEYANGTWAKNTPIPADKARYGMFNVLDDLSKERTRTIIDEQAKDPNSKIGNAYESFMDEAAIESKGLTPFDPWLSEVRGIKSKAALTKAYADADHISIDTPFRMFVGQDRKNSDQYALNVLQGGLGMPDRDYYLSTDPKLVETKAKYLQHLTNMLSLAGEANAAARARAILDFETKVAKVHWARAESRDANKTYNKMTMAQVRKFAPGFDFPTYLKDEGANVDYVIVFQPSAFKGISGLIGSTPLPVLRDQLLVRSLDSYADYLPKTFDDENFAFYGTVLSGTPQQEPRWKRAVNFTVDTMGDDVSKLYVAK